MTIPRPGEKALRKSLRQLRTTTRTDHQRVKTLKLRIFDVLCQHFNKSELKTLCFVLGLQAEDFTADNKISIARELVSYYLTRDALDTLKTAILERRSDLTL